MICSIIKSPTEEKMKIILPPCWYTSGDIGTHIETVMHLVFLGVSQTVGKVLKETLTAFHIYSNFHTNESELRNICSLQIDWCKTWVFGSQKTPFGLCVSETLLHT